MVIPALSITSPSTQSDAPARVTREDVAVAAVSKVLRQHRQEGADLVRLVEQSGTAEGKGQAVNYYG